jgi:hypothetical protein
MFVALSPEIDRAVLNVPGADTVDLFKDSDFFGDQIKGFFAREKITWGSGEAERFLNVARWFIDGTDPQSVATLLGQGRRVLLQRATTDEVIPKANTFLLRDLAGVRQIDYDTGPPKVIISHAFLVVPIIDGNAITEGQNDITDFLQGRLVP